jgi:hypothetical protein
MIDEVKNVTAPNEVYLWESSPAPSPAASLTRAAPPETVARWAAALLSAAEDWLRDQAASIFAQDAPMDVDETHAAMNIEEASSEPHADVLNVTAGHADDSASSNGLVNRWNKAVVRERVAGSSDGVGDRSESSSGPGVTPCRFPGHLCRGNKVEIAGLPLPLAPRFAVRVAKDAVGEGGTRGSVARRGLLLPPGPMLTRSTMGGWPPLYQGQAGAEET